MKRKRIVNERFKFKFVKKQQTHKKRKLTKENVRKKDEIKIYKTKQNVKWTR